LQILLASQVAQEIGKSSVVESICYLCKEIQNLNKQNCKAIKLQKYCVCPKERFDQVELRKAEKLGGEGKATKKGGFCQLLSMELVMIKVCRF